MGGRGGAHARRSAALVRRMKAPAGALLALLSVAATPVAAQTVEAPVEAPADAPDDAAVGTPVDGLSFGGATDLQPQLEPDLSISGAATITATGAVPAIASEGGVTLTPDGPVAPEGSPAPEGPLVSNGPPAGTATGVGATPHYDPAATVDAHGICAHAIDQAASRHGVPLDLMLAIGRVESGLSPWVINAAGQGIRFASLGEAVAGVEALRAQGVQSIDVGCMQVNLRWHPDAFASLAEAFVPETNADYAARYLRRLFADTGSWDGAMARYHSADPIRQARYACAVRAERARLLGNPVEPCGVPGPAIETAASTFASGAAVISARSMVDGAVVLVGRTGSGGTDSRVISGGSNDDRVVSGNR